MKTINIKGKPYVMVNERIKEFRTNYKGYRLITEIVNLTEDSCIMKASVIDPEGNVVATGHAQEDQNSSMINKTSFIENCETSAVGRCLGIFGIGIDESIASAEEVVTAIARQVMESDEIVGGSYVLRGGKYDGKTIQEVYEIDKGYLHYCIENGKSQIVKLNMIKCFTDNGEVVEQEV